MLKRINKKLFYSFLLVLLTGILLWTGLHYVPKGQVRLSLKDDMLGLKTSEAMMWRNSGLLMSITIDPKLGDKEDRFSVMAYVYKQGDLIFSKEVGALQNSLEDNKTTIQLYQKEGTGFKLESVGAGMGLSTEYFLAELKTPNGFGMEINEKVQMTKGDDEKVVAIYTIGSKFRSVNSKMTLEEVQPFNENPMTVVFTVKYEEKE